MRERERDTHAGEGTVECYLVFLVCAIAPFQDEAVALFLVFLSVERQ